MIYLKNINYKIIKKLSKKNISIKDNLNILRLLQKIINPISKDTKYEDIYIPINDRNIRLRIFNNFNDKINHKIIYYIHGGGWVSGDINYYTNICNEISIKTKRIVILIDYRLAPEYPFPNGFNDCYEIGYLLVKNSKIFNISPKDIVFMGDSAGGNLVAAISLKCRDTHDYKIYKEILIYPALQNDYSLSTSYKSVVTNGSDYLLTRKNLQEYMDLYINDFEDLKNPYVSPLNSKKYKHLPETLIVTGELDPLRDEGREYAKRLKKGKNKVVHIEYDNAIHGFMTNSLAKEYQKLLIKDIIKFLGDKDE